MSDFWWCCLECLDGEFGVEELYIWLMFLQVCDENMGLQLFVFNLYMLDMVCDCYLLLIESVLQQLIGYVLMVCLEVGLSVFCVVLSWLVSVFMVVWVVVGVVVLVLVIQFSYNLDLYYIFEIFVEGKFNQLGKVVVMQVVINLGWVYNLLLLYGGIGLGKIYLMYVVGNLMCECNLDFKVLYLCLEQFVGLMIEVLCVKSMDQFKQCFCLVDVLLIDDI